MHKIVDCSWACWRNCSTEYQYTKIHHLSHSLFHYHSCKPISRFRGSKNRPGKKRMNDNVQKNVHTVQSKQQCLGVYVVGVIKDSAALLSTAGLQRKLGLICTQVLALEAYLQCFIVVYSPTQSTENFWIENVKPPDTCTIPHISLHIVLIIPHALHTQNELLIKWFFFLK